MEPQHIIDACETNWEAHKHKADCSGTIDFAWRAGDRDRVAYFAKSLD
jgi:hypothetical protein